MMIQDGHFFTSTSATGVYSPKGSSYFADVSGITILDTGSGDNVVAASTGLARSTVISGSASDTLIDEYDVAYASLRDSLDEMSGLDEDESLYIDDQTYRSSLSALNFLQYYEVPTPKIYSHGGDAVVFTWAFGPASLQLTVSNGIAALGRRIKGEGSYTVGYVDLSMKSIAELFPFVKVGSGRARSSSFR